MKAIAEMSGKNTAQGGTLEGGQKKNAPGGVRYSLRTEFANELQEWFDTTTHDERKVSGIQFLVGETTEVLKSIGVRDCPIYFGGSKIEKILEKNSSMDIDIIKQAVNLLEDPILIMQSRTVDGSIVLFGDVYTSGGKPVMLSLLLNPQNKSGDILDYTVITSAYGRRMNNLQNLIDSSQIYFVNENKNRTEGWLQALGLQLPSAVTKLDSINRIADLNSKVNRITMENKENELAAVGATNSLRGLADNVKFISNASIAKQGGDVKQKYSRELETVEELKKQTELQDYLPELQWLADNRQNKRAKFADRMKI